MLNFEILILKLIAIDRLASSAVSNSEIATLRHELRDHTVEPGSLVVQWLSLLADTLLTSGQCFEILGADWCVLPVQLEHKPEWSIVLMRSEYV